MGAHVIKVGLNPVVIDLMERGIITAVAMNGAGIIHDLEIAMAGQTSEDVAASIGNGSFGMAHETTSLMPLIWPDKTLQDSGNPWDETSSKKICPLWTKASLRPGRVLAYL